MVPGPVGGHDEVGADGGCGVADVRCLDATLLTVLPVPVLDRDGVPYEATLRMLRDGEPFGDVGERCAWSLRCATALLREADGLPVSTLEAGVRAWARDTAVDPDATWHSLERRLPRDRELLALLARDPDDLSSTGELRVRLRAERTWVDGAPRGCWELSQSAVLDAWGTAGTGVRAVLDRPALLQLLEALTGEVDAVVGPEQA